MEHIIGIDFGTTNTVAAIITPAGPKIILDHDGNKLTPSVVARSKGALKVGYDAKHNVDAFGNGQAVKEIKRKIGLKETVKFGGEEHKPYEIASLILKKVKRNVEINLDEHVKKAIITVPAEFSDAQRNEIIQAGKIAGFEVEKIINEPTAAIMAYVYRRNLTTGTVLCYDFGGGTFDVSVADIQNKNIVVRCVGGDRKLGGTDIDQTVLSEVNKRFEAITKSQLSKKGLYELSLVVEEVKIKLSKSETASINGSFSATSGDRVKFFLKIERNTFENWIKHHIEKTISNVQMLLDENGISPIRDIDHVLLVGGSSQIPLVAKKLHSLFGQKLAAGEIYAEVSVAIGAALEANNRLREKVIGPGPRIGVDVSPYTVGLKAGIDGNEDVFDPIIRKNFPYGREYSEKYDTAIDYQNTMLLEIYQGENAVASKNEHICDFEIEGIPEREAGKESVRVAFLYDENGIINIKATILSTGRQITKSITHKSKSAQINTSQSQSKINKHFTSDREFSEAIKLKKTLEQYAMSKESKQLEEALKKDDNKAISKMRASLLDD